jgi:hypothetical protein
VRRPSLFNRAAVRTLVRVLEALGKTVTAVRFHPDGTCEATVRDAGAEAKADINEWDRVLADDQKK